MIQSCIIGVDAGTTGTKSVLFSRQGQPLAHSYRSYPLRTTPGGHSEQDANDWWTALQETVREVVEALPPGETVAAIAISSQGGTVVPVDRAFRPLRPAIVWNDTRARREADIFQAAFPNGALYQKTGWPAGPGQPLMQLLWLRENEPDVFRQAAWFLTVHDFLSARLTGCPAVDLSNAGINQLANILTGSYDAQLLAFAGVEEDRLAKIVPSGRAIGYLTEEAASALNLTCETILISGAHDQYAAALGAGSGSGEVLVGSGTAWVLTSLDTRPHFESGTPQSRAALPGQWGSVASLTTGGVCLEWFRTHLAPGWTDTPMDYAELDRLAEAVPPGANGLCFYPHLSGAPAPLPNPLAAGTLLGLRLSHNSWDVARAIMEGVVFQLSWLLEKFPARSLCLSGGAARSALWTSILADVTGLPVSIPALPDLPCAGMALLAANGAGLFRLEQGRELLRVKRRTVQPDPDRMALYAPLRQEYIARASIVNELYIK